MIRELDTTSFTPLAGKNLSFDYHRAPNFSRHLERLIRTANHSPFRNRKVELGENFLTHIFIHFHYPNLSPRLLFYLGRPTSLPLPSIDIIDNHLKRRHSAFFLATLCYTFSVKIQAFLAKGQVSMIKYTYCTCLLYTSP